MLSLIFFGLVIYYFRQITTYTQSSFRQGIVILKYKEPFSDKIPEEVMNQEIICKNIIFRFNTPYTGLFRAYPRGSMLKNRRTYYLPSLLGEIKLSRKGIAQITLRIPLSITLMLLTLLVASVISSTQLGFTINSVLVSVTEVAIAMLIFGIFAIIGYVMEKGDLHDGVIMLRERAKSNSIA